MGCDDISDSQRAWLTGGAEAVVNDERIFGEIMLFPVMCVNPFEDGGLIHMRLGISHRVDGCNWSVSFPGVPTSAVPATAVFAALEEHRAECPVTRS
jgi:hypothetical protein